MSKDHNQVVKRGRKRSKKVSNYREIFEVSMATNYSTPSLTIVSGKGSYLRDSEGKRYLDFLSGIATNALGAAHPKVIAAVNAQLRKVSHISNFYANPETLRLATRLVEKSGDASARVFFCNSGTEANEAAIKLAYLTGKRQIVAMEGSFHGRTIGSLSMTGQPSKRKPFEPLLKKIRFVPYGDLRALQRAVNRRTAMVIAEPIQGENGVVVPPAGFLKAVEEICREKGALFAIDAVQTGIGRTGQWFGYEDEEVRPDIVTLAKALGGGLPMGAMLSMGHAPKFSPGDHGSTFGGNPVVAAAANAVIDTIEKDWLMDRAKVLHEYLRSSLEAVGGVRMVRGKGLLIGVVLDAPIAREVTVRLQNYGVLVNATSDEVLRLAPPLVISDREARSFLAIFREVMAGTK